MPTESYHIDDLSALLHEKEWAGTEGWEEEGAGVVPAPLSVPQGRAYLVTPRVDIFNLEGAYYGTYPEAREAAIDESWSDSTVGIWQYAGLDEEGEETYALIAVVYLQEVYVREQGRGVHP